MAGTERIELPLTEPESVVLPLDEVPMLGSNILQREKILYVNEMPSASPRFAFFEISVQHRVPVFPAPLPHLPACSQPCIFQMQN